MKKYQIKQVNNILVNGDLHSDLKYLFSCIKSYLRIKKEDEDKVHPMEIERNARKRAKENAGRIRTANATLSDYLKPIKASKSPASNGLYSNSAIFLTGDNGFGFHSEKYYMDILEKYNKILAYNDTYLFFVRGNNDDPDYFDGEKIDFSNIKAVPDYSVVEVNDKKILCIGGAISTDRMWRKEQQERINGFSNSKKTLYWENEAPVLCKEKMDEIFKEYGSIDYVVSHTAPSFADPMTRMDEWTKTDPELKKDLTNERVTMDRIFEYLRDNDSRPEYWAYGHFNQNILNYRSGTLFKSLQSGFAPNSISADIALNSIKSLSPDTLNGKKLKATFDRGPRLHENLWENNDIVVENNNRLEVELPDFGDEAFDGEEDGRNEEQIPDEGQNIGQIMPQAPDEGQNIERIPPEPINVNVQYFNDAINNRNYFVNIANE